MAPRKHSAIYLFSATLAPAGARSASHGPVCPAAAAGVLAEARDAGRFPPRPPLSQFCDQVIRIEDHGFPPARPGLRLILGVDAGLTTTKAILLDRESDRPSRRFLDSQLSARPTPRNCRLTRTRFRRQMESECLL